MRLEGRREYLEYPPVCGQPSRPLVRSFVCPFFCLLVCMFVCMLRVPEAVRAAAVDCGQRTQTNKHTHTAASFDEPPKAPKDTQRRRAAPADGAANKTTRGAAHTPQTNKRTNGYTGKPRRAHSGRARVQDRRGHQPPAPLEQYSPRYSHGTRRGVLGSTLVVGAVPNRQRARRRGVVRTRRFGGAADRADLRRPTVLGSVSTPWEHPVSIPLVHLEHPRVPLQPPRAAVSTPSAPIEQP